jgi:hypothetical protein
VAAAVLAVVGASACVSKPTMHLNHAEISGVQIGFPPQFDVMMTIVLDVYNPNSYDVAVREVHGTTVMGGAFALPVNFVAPTADGVWMPAQQTTSMRVPVVVPINVALGVLQQAAASPTIPYRFTGRANVTATRTLQLEKDDYAVDESGVVTRDQIAAVIPASIPH